MVEDGKILIEVDGSFKKNGAAYLDEAWDRWSEQGFKLNKAYLGESGWVTYTFVKDV